MVTCQWVTMRPCLWGQTLLSEFMKASKSRISEARGSLLQQMHKRSYQYKLQYRIQLCVYQVEYGILIGSYQVEYCILIGSYQVEYGILIGSYQVEYGILIGSYQVEYGILIGSYQVEYGILIGSYQVEYGILIGSYYVEYGILMGSYQVEYGILIGSYQVEYGILIGSCETDAADRTTKIVARSSARLSAFDVSILFLEVAYGDPGLTYTFSGVTIPAKPWTPLLLQIKEHIESTTEKVFNFVLVNRCV